MSENRTPSIQELNMSETATAAPNIESNGTAVEKTVRVGKSKVKPAKKPAKAKAEKVKKTAKVKADGPSIRKPQLRILAALAKSKAGSLPVSLIAEKAGVPATHISGYTFLATKTKIRQGVVALAEMGLVREISVPLDGGGKERCAEITAKGRKAVEK